eukprot:3690490-Rhodomonas_salina.1
MHQARRQRRQPAPVWLGPRPAPKLASKQSPVRARHAGWPPGFKQLPGNIHTAEEGRYYDEHKE